MNKNNEKTQCTHESEEERRVEAETTSVNTTDHLVESTDQQKATFANQLLSLIHLAKEGKNLENKVYDIPVEQDEGIAELKLKLMGYEIDKLTEGQIAYQDAYFEGT